MSNYTNNLFDPETKNNSWVHLFEFVPEKTRVLDIGCSSGNFGHVLINEKHCEVVGLDIDAPDIAEAKKKLTAAYVRNIEREEIKDLGMFDVIVFADVLEHLLDPIAALEKVKKQLKKGGRIVFSIPNMAHISIRIQLMKGFFEYMPIGVLDRTHLHYYDEIEVKHIFSEAKMAIQEINPATLSYPESKVSEELYHLGLGIVDQAKLNEILEDTKSNVWQFVGYALPVAQKVPVDRKIKYRSPPEELQITLEARDRELKLIGKRLQELEAENRHMSEFYHNPVKGGLKRAARRVRALQDKRAKPSK
jgi:2-polyprenyl-3-methyl-5-hydroxy-6-metoxy-1,4-benzoquinol methylase